MVGNNHNWDVISKPFWSSECEKYQCKTIGTPSRGYGLIPICKGYDWDEAYDSIREIYGDELHRFKSQDEAQKAFSILSEGLINQNEKQ